MGENYFYWEEGEKDAYLFHKGLSYKSYEFLGAHPIKKGKKEAVRFVVWAPRAKEVYLIGDFNNWHETSLPLERIGETGLWNICLKGVKEFDSYKYRIASYNGEVRIKADPYAFHAETRPKTASKYYDLKGFKWEDEAWLRQREKNSGYDQPMSIYEVNLSSWRKKPDGSPYSYRDLAKELVRYVKTMGFTHVELMPIMEHPYDGSWGYQQTGYFAPTSRFGTPKEFMDLINEFHKNQIGVILDWVPFHFCKDDHGLARFDGTECFESSNRALAENNIWGTLNFDYKKDEVISFLISNAIYWHDYYHIDGLRIDAVAYMLYLNHAGRDIKNRYGGYENIEAIEFIKKLNQTLLEYFPHSKIIAEDSSNWPSVTGPVEDGGLGFKYKWNMGWMNDTLEYMETDPLFRKGNQKALTFGITYCFSENYILPLSHDEVVHGKKSLLNKMPGSYDEKFASLRLLYLYMYAYPGKKLLFMGGEFGQFIEWDEFKELDWHLLDYEKHGKMQRFIKDLNTFYREESCLYDLDNTYDGFEWIEHTNHQESIIAFERINRSGEKIIGVFNFTPVERKDYPIGVDHLARYRTIINTDQAMYGGNLPRRRHYRSTNQPIHGREYSIRIPLPPLGGIILKKG